jgi:hypothetical protein
MNIKNRHGTHPRKHTAKTLERIKQMKKENKTVPEMAKVLGYHKRTIFRLIAENNLCY